MPNSCFPRRGAAADARAYNRAMDYQLVLKFRRTSHMDVATVAALQEPLAQALDASSTLDGYDVSAREINLFVITSDPKPAFRRLKDVLEARALLTGVSAAYRLVGGARFTSLWPLRTTRTFRLP